MSNAGDLRPDELEILLAACRARDTVDELTAGMSGQELTTKGSMGQLRIHPLIEERRFQEQAMANLLAKLKLPDDTIAETTAFGSNVRPMSRSDVGRLGASARWGNRHGAA